MPQIIMLNHASWVNGERMKKSSDKKSAQSADDGEDPVVWNGKRLSEMNSDEWMLYYGGMGGM